MYSESILTIGILLFVIGQLMFIKFTIHVFIKQYVLFSSFYDQLKHKVTSDTDVTMAFYSLGNFVFEVAVVVVFISSPTI